MRAYGGADSFLKMLSGLRGLRASPTKKQGTQSVRKDLVRCVVRCVDHTTFDRTFEIVTV